MRFKDGAFYILYSLILFLCIFVTLEVDQAEVSSLCVCVSVCVSLSRSVCLSYIIMWTKWGGAGVGATACSVRTEKTTLKGSVVESESESAFTILLNIWKNNKFVVSRSSQRVDTEH